MTAKILIDKIKDSKAKTFYAKVGDVVHVYDTSRPDVWLCKNKLGETFSVRKEFLIIKK